MYLVLRRQANDKSVLYEKCMSADRARIEKKAAEVAENNGKHVLVIAKVIEFGVDVSVFMDEGKDDELPTTT